MYVLLIGSGGAARAVVVALAEERYSQSHNCKPRYQTSKRTCHARRGAWDEVPGYTTWYDNRCFTTCDLIINATTIGMNNEPSLIDYHHIQKGSIVYDIVYRQLWQTLLKMPSMPKQVWFMDMKCLSNRVRRHLRYGQDCLLLGMQWKRTCLGSLVSRHDDNG